MDYTNIRVIRKRIITSLVLILAIFLLSGAVTHIFFQVQMLLRWLTIIAIGVLCCNIWASIVAYNVSIRYQTKMKSLENDIYDLKRKIK